MKNQAQVPNDLVFINPNCVNSSEDENEVEEVQQDTSEEEEEVPDPKLGKLRKEFNHNILDEK